MNNLWLHIAMRYDWWKCRKCRKGDHEWVKSTNYIHYPKPIYTEHCKRRSCTAIR